MKKDGGSGLMTMLMVGGGALAVYWYVNNYGPNGAVSAGSVSWWQSWFGTATVSAPAGTVSTAVMPPSYVPPATTTTTSPVMPSTPPVPSAITIPSGFTVAQDINNSLKGTVMLNGVSTTLNVIPANVGGNGIIWNTNGADVTGQFTSAQVQQLVQAFVAAGQAQGLSGIVQVPWKQSGANLSGMSFNSTSKGFAGGFSSRRKSTAPPYVN